MTTKQLALTAVVVVIVGGIGFGAGMKYQSSRQPAWGRLGATGNRAGNMMRPSGGREAGGQLMNRLGGRPVAGEVIAINDNTLTIKSPDGSTRLVVLSETTNINQATTADKSEIKVGSNVAVFGSDNSDGSVTAQNVQLNPRLMEAKGSESSSPSPSPTNLPY